MFDKQTIGLYKSITAPESLKTRILEGDSPKATFAGTGKKRLRAFASTAAVIAASVALYVSVTLPNGTPTVSVGGTDVGKTAVAINMPAKASRAMPAAMSAEDDAMTGKTLTVEFTVETDKDTNIAVSHGYVSDGLDRLTISEDTVLVWHLEDITDDTTPLLTIQSGKRQTVYRLTNDSTTGTWFITAQ